VPLSKQPKAWGSAPPNKELKLTKQADRTIVCGACGASFLWTTAEQAARGRYRLPEPRVCSNCVSAPVATNRPRRRRLLSRRREQPTVRSLPPHPQMLSCVTCGNDFYWGVKAQASFAKRGWDQPKRCPPCAKRRKVQVSRATRGTHAVSGGLPSLGKRR